MAWRGQCAAAVALLGVIAIAGPAPADAPEAGKFKAEIDAFVAHIAGDTNGAVAWLGSDPYEIRHDGDGLVAVIRHARLALRAPDSGSIAFDRIEIRRREAEAGKLIALAIKLPSEATLADGAAGRITLALKDAAINTVVEAASGRSRDTEVTAAGGRIEEARTGSWLRFGPLSLAAKTIPEAGGGWRAPAHFALQQVEFFAAAEKAPVAGTIDAITAEGRSAGPDLAGLYRLRDALDALKRDAAEQSPQARLQALWPVLAKMPSLLGDLRMAVALNGLTVRLGPELLLKLAKADVAAEVGGLSSGEAGLRLTLRDEGLEVGPSLGDPGTVPRHMVIDVGVGHLDTKVLDKVIAAVGDLVSGPADDAKKQAAMQRIMAAAAMLEPTYRLYDVAVDTRDVGVDLTGEATGSPLAPKGYAASGLLKVRGLDAGVRLAGSPMLREYLPLLKEIAVEDKAADGTPSAEFRLASAPGKVLTVNGNDLTAWFTAEDAGPGEPRLLKPAEPPQQGSDVRAVQEALAAAHIRVGRTGRYDGATAAAVARFQKQNGLAANGIVDAATRRKLGLAGPARRRGRN